MNRVEFTRKIVQLLYEMIQANEKPIIDYVLRSTEEQKRLYNEGKSKCDGVIKKSNHQLGVAMDIYFVDENNKLDFSKDRYKKWHKIWEEKYDGKPIIEWDLPHFE